MEEVQIIKTNNKIYFGPEYKRKGEGNNSTATKWLYVIVKKSGGAADIKCGDAYYNNSVYTTEKNAKENLWRYEEPVMKGIE